MHRILQQNRQAPGGEMGLGQQPDDRMGEDKAVLCPDPIYEHGDARIEEMERDGSIVAADEVELMGR